MGKMLDEIRKIAKEREEKIEEGEKARKLEITSFREDDVRSIERKYKKKELDEAGLVDELKKKFGYHLDRDDYERIEKAIR